MNRTVQHHKSVFEATFSSNNSDVAVYEKSVKFVEENDKWVRKMFESNNKLDAWWSTVALVWAQLDGLVAGHNWRADQHQQLTLRDFLILNAVVDLSSIIHKPFTDTVESARAFTRNTTHCSALVKVLPDLSELFTAHNTWTAYYMMLRVVKTYNLPFQRINLQATSMRMSGYFGTLSSTDDFYLLSSKLVVQETTNAVYNQSLLNTIKPSAVLTWARSLVANRLASDGRKWTELFVRENSGTINNQWMVVNYGLFVPFHSLKPGTLWIIEQLPGFTQAKDMTDVLSYGYWPSYNRAYFSEVRRRSGALGMVAEYGDEYSYELYARAKIFRRDHGKVVDRSSLQALMRYNDWRRDPFSNHSAEDSIAARDDLLPNGQETAFGNIDAKMVSFTDVNAMQFEGISGPTHAEQPIFIWSGASEHVQATPHYGQPDAFNFSWQLF